ncbi:MAG: hypothetical protein FWF02_00915 [Micrococcales bacterium]|nr:hypothetical protein [Micrococcales bacterium]MCL2666257.1 hypothetical protein [Micrococcales bacterium]
MALNLHVNDAVDVFVTLGWADADPAGVLDLPLGTPEQQKIALAGLRTGEWGHIAWEQWIAVDPGEGAHPTWFFDRDRRTVMLALFAVRLGVDGRHAAVLLSDAHLDSRTRKHHMGHVLRDAVAAVVEQRGAGFAQKFLTRAVVEESWWWGYPSVLVGLVERYGLPVPRRASYLEAWLGTVIEVLFGERVVLGGVVTGCCGPSSVLPVSGADRFAEHVEAAVAAHIPVGVQEEGSQPRPQFGLDHVMAEGVERGWLDRDEAVALFAQLLADGVVPDPQRALGCVLADAVARGWVDRDDAVDTALVGLDAAARPIVRTMWLDTWFGPLHGTDAEVVSRAEALVSVLASGDPRTVERLAPTLIAGVCDEILADVLTAALSVTTKKALRVVLTAVAARPRPSSATVQAVGPQVTALDPGSDKALARVVAQVVDHWGLTQQAPAPAVVHRWWQPVPPVWQVPRFDRGPGTPEALTTCVAHILARRPPDRRQEGRREGGVVDIVVEQFLAVANTIAREAPQAVRAALSGLPARPVQTGTVGVRWAAWYVHGDTLARDYGTRLWTVFPEAWWGERTTGLLWPREAAVFDHLGQVPCLLSEPSWVDLRIDPADMVARLARYAEEGVPASEADLALALTRLDVTLADDVVDAGLAALGPVPVLVEPVRATWAERAPSAVIDVTVWPGLTAGAAVRQYLGDPFDPGRPVGEPSTDSPETGFLATVAAKARQQYLGGFGAVSAFPTGDTAPLRTDDDDADVLGVWWRQAVRRTAPLSALRAVQLLAAQRSPRRAAADDLRVAVTEAWQRGLLRPRALDATRLLDHVPMGVAATLLVDLAHQGMLALAWPVLDDLALSATAGPRLPAGTVDVAQSIADLFGEVVAAVGAGTADPSPLALPGTRALAAWGGSSQAVTTACKTVATLDVGLDT